MGGAWTERHDDAGTVLVPAQSGAEADLVIPDADDVLTLNAHSVLLPEYCLRLVHPLERVTGATTDLQHILAGRQRGDPKGGLRDTVEVRTEGHSWSTPASRISDRHRGHEVRASTSR